MHKNNVENPQYYPWNARGDHILGLSSLIEMLQNIIKNIKISKYHLKWCAHITSTL